MWWVGHAQLFIAVFLGVVGPSFLLVTFLTQTYLVIGWLASAMALPFAVSGSMLRAYGAAMAESRQATPALMRCGDCSLLSTSLL